MKPSPSSQESQSSPAGPPAPLNVLYVIGSLPVGGAESQVVTLASALPRDRYRVHVCCLRHEGIQANILRSRGIPVHALHMRQRTLPVAAFRLYRLIRQLNPQIVHTHLDEADLWGGLIARLAGVPVIISTLHGMLYKRRFRDVLLSRLASRSKDRIIAVSEDLRQRRIRSERLAPEKIITLSNAIETERFRREDCREHARAELGIQPSSPLVGTVARLVPAKRLDYFLQAARMVTDRAPESFFVIIGDGALRAELESQAADLGLAPERVKFLGSRADIPELLSALDIFVICSEREGLPVSLLEAMAASRPVIATKVGGIPKLIEDQHNGILLQPHDPNALSDAILMLLKDERLRQGLAYEGQRTVEGRFSTTVIIRQMTELYEDLLEKKCLPRTA